MIDISDILHSRTFTEKLLRSLPCALLLFDRSGNVLDVNNASKRLFGSTAVNNHPKADLGGIMNCLNANDHSADCGTDEVCRQCKVRNLALSSIKENRYLESTTPYQIVKNGQIRDTVLAISAAPHNFNGDKFCLLIVENLKSKESTYEADTQMGFHGIVGQNERMLDLFDTIRQISASNDPVLLQGESGTGKELVALAIHRESTRADRHFVPVNCSALPEGLLESEMFGHIKGAFTGATYNKKGRFKIADRGTIFLDEISELNPSMQAKFLRAIETGSYEPVGSDQSATVDFRVISATNRFLDEEIGKGRFRRDLYYRLNVIPILLPPLRSRRDDIFLLTNYFLKKFTHRKHQIKPKLSREAISILENYRWPGNVRELQNTLKYALLKCQGGRITPAHFPYYLFKNKIHHVVARRPRKLKLNIADVADALQKAKGNKRWAAEILGVSRSTLYRFFERQKGESR